MSEDFIGDGLVPGKSAIVNLLNKFLKTRPSKEDLVQNRVLKSDFRAIPLRYSLIDILCSRLERTALSVEGIFRISGSAQQIRLFWSTFTSDNIEMPLNDHTVAGALKLYIREQTEPLIPYELFSSYIASIANTDDSISVSDLIQLFSRISPENLRIIKRIIRLLIVLVRHSENNKMHASNMGIVFGPNIFKSKPDSMNVIFESKFGNEAVTTIIDNYRIIFPDLEVPLLGTETTTLSGDKSNSSSSTTCNNNESNNNTPGVVGASSAASAPSPLSLVGNSASVSSPILISNSIQNSKSMSKTQLQPIHPSLQNTSGEGDVHSSSQQNATSSLSMMKRKELSMLHHLTRKLKKSKHYKNQECWDYFLVLKVVGNLVMASKSMGSSSASPMEISKTLTKKSSSNLQTNTNPIKLVPIYVLISSENIFFFDSINFEIQNIIPHYRLRDISLDTVNKGLFSLLENDTHKLSFYMAPKQKTIDHLVRSLEKGRSIAKLTFRSMIHLQAKRYPLLHGGAGTNNAGFVKVPESRPVFESLAESGFTELDVWEGTADLLEVVKKFRAILVPAETKAVVEFLLPTIDEFKGIYRKSYKLDIHTSVYKIISLICEKAKLEPSKFLLRTLKGRTLFDNLSLYDYGLGSLFTTWQLRLISLNSPENTGTFVVEFWFPDSPEFKGMQKKALKVDAYQPMKRLTKDLCDRLKVPKYHYYQIVGPEGEILSDNDTLSSIGLGIKFKTCKMKITKKVFPVGKDPVKNQEIAQSLIVDNLLTLAWNKIRDRHNERIKQYCKHMLEYIIDQTFVEISKAELVPKRVGQLGKNSRAEFYAALAAKEEEELILCNTNGYRNTLIKARTIVYDDPEPSPNSPLYKAKLPNPTNLQVTTGGALGLRNIKINNARNPFLNELKEMRKSQQEKEKPNISNNSLSSVQLKPLSPTQLRLQKMKQYQVQPIQSTGAIVSLLSLKPGTSKLVEQLKRRMDISVQTVDTSHIEDLVPFKK